MTTYYKCLTKHNKSAHGGKDITWSLPTQNPDGSWTPGEWMPAVRGEVELCKNGYHVCELKNILNWMAENIYTAELSGETGDILVDTFKTAGRSIRLLTRTSWDSRTKRLFICDCAERVLPILNEAFPYDTLFRKTVETSRLYAKGLVTDSDLERMDYQIEALFKGITVTTENKYIAEAAYCIFLTTTPEREIGGALLDFTWRIRRIIAGEPLINFESPEMMLSPSYNSKWHESYRAEAEWQINRLKYYLEGGT